jgi:hypothetical protein
MMHRGALVAIARVWPINWGDRETSLMVLVGVVSMLVFVLVWSGARRYRANALGLKTLRRAVQRLMLAMSQAGIFGIDITVAVTPLSAGRSIRFGSDGCGLS